MMKKFLTSILLAAALAASACWSEHETGGGTAQTPGSNSLIRVDGRSVDSVFRVALPATLEVKVVRFQAARPITRVVLQVEESGVWRTIYDLPHIPASAEADFVPIFGIETLKPEMAANGSLRFRVHLSDGWNQSFDLDAGGSVITLRVSANRRPGYEE